MSKPLRLHPIAAVSTFLKQLKEMILPIIASTAFGGGIKEWSALFIPVGLVTFALIYGVLTWLRYTYRVEENEIRIESGIFVRKKRYIPFERIQNLNQTEGILHRPFRLVKLKVETAAQTSKNEAEAELAAISKEEADRIQQIFTSIKTGEASPEMMIQAQTTADELIYKITPQELLVLACTSGGVGVIISAIVAIVSQFNEMIPYERLFHRFENIIANGIVFVSILVLIVFIVVWILALIGTLLKYANFTVVKNGADLVISRGLIEKRKITIPFKRIQAIRITQNILRQPLGFATVYLENAGGSFDENGLTQTMVLPLVRRNQIVNILQKWFPDYQLDVVLLDAPKRALPRYLWKGLLVVLPIMIIAVSVFPVWGWFSVLLLVLSSCLQYWSFRDSGWNIKGNQLTLQYRSLNKNIVFFKKNKVQALEYKVGFLQARKSLATIKATVVSGISGTHAKVVDIDREHAQQIFQWYSHEKKTLSD